MNNNTNNNTNNDPFLLLASYTPGQIDFIKFLQMNRNSITVYDTCTVTRKDMVDLIRKGSYIAVPAWIAAVKARRVGRGNYLIPEIHADINTLPMNENKRGRKPGSPNQKGRTPMPPASSSSSHPALATMNA